MSGGRWDYLNDSLSNEVYEGCYPDYRLSDERVKQISLIARKENPLCDKDISQLLYDVLCVMHSCDWWQSGDSNEEQYRKDVRYFKEKWFNNPTWVSSQDKLPDEYNPYVLGFDADAYDVIIVGYDNDFKEWRDYRGMLHNITYWMPLPAPPKQNERDS